MPLSVNSVVRRLFEPPNKMHDLSASEGIEEAAALDNLNACKGAGVNAKSGSSFLSNAIQHKVILEEISGQQQAAIGLD